MRTLVVSAILLAACLPACAEESTSSAGAPDQALSLVVMDPLAAPLSCPCVEGYAQRQYDKLADYLGARLGRPVRVTFAESFERALAKEGCTAIDVVIGKDSVVRHDANEFRLKVTPLARLTGKDGRTTQTGLIVVRAADPAQRARDLRGYRILFGTPECDEKFAAARTLLKEAGVALPAVEAAETAAACSDGACKIIEWGDSEHAAAVISSYAAPLLEGCGTIQKGDLRVIGETEPVPFITAFATDRVGSGLREEIREALLAAGSHAELLAALETLVGFVPLDDDYRRTQSVQSDAADQPAADAVESATESTSAWPGWRGPTRDGHVPLLPRVLPSEARILWRQPLGREGLGGIAATDKFVVLGDRDVSNTRDEFRCYAAADGEPRWIVQYPALGRLDYDNTPRATPLVYHGHVYLFGAFGHLSCVELETGLVLWQMNVLEQFAPDAELVWGTCSSPLVVDDRLIINPGGPEASLVALRPRTGELIWKSPGERHAFSSFIVATLGGVRQLVGYDRASLGGWDIATGRRLWTLTPPYQGDFNVPTPVAVAGQLLVMTENNGTRLYGFDHDGRIIAKPVATNDQCAPEVSSPVVVGDRVFCVCREMFCLGLANQLQTIWIGQDKAFCDYSPLLASANRVLAVGRGGELLLIDAASDSFEIVSRLQVFTDRDAREVELLSHPALVGTRLYMRGAKELVCVELAQPEG